MSNNIPSKPNGAITWKQVPVLVGVLLLVGAVLTCSTSVVETERV